MKYYTKSAGGVLFGRGFVWLPWMGYSISLHFCNISFISSYFLP